MPETMDPNRANKSNSRISARYWTRGMRTLSLSTTTSSPQKMFVFSNCKLKWFQFRLSICQSKFIDSVDQVETGYKLNVCEIHDSLCKKINDFFPLVSLQFLTVASAIISTTKQTFLMNLFERPKQNKELSRSSKSTPAIGGRSKKINDLINGWSSTLFPILTMTRSFINRISIHNQPTNH